MMRKTFGLMAALGAIAALAACGHTPEQKAATGAVGGAVVGGPVGAAVGGAAGAAVGQAEKDQGK
jgi:osmotically inducible lipoprotein OsmB